MRHWFDIRGALALLVTLTVASCAPDPEPERPAPRPAALEGAAVLESWPPPRPVPEPVAYPRDFSQALEAGTRTTDGTPGADYWQQWTEYDISAKVDVANKRVDGTTRVRYHNRSPDRLAFVVLELAQNLHAPGVQRAEQAEVTQGFELVRVTTGGQALTEAEGQLAGPGYQVMGTRMGVRLPQPLPPGGTTELEITYAFTIPQRGAGARMGHSAENLVFLAYWHPRMAVYDDVIGWHMDPFLGNAEFYHGFGSYRYSIDAPAGWLVLGTGELVNAEETLAAPVLERLRQAEQSDEVVQVLGPGQASQATQAGRNGRLVWRFEADSVRDIAVSLTRESRWDAARTPVGDLDGDGATDYARVDALWRPTAPLWRNVAEYAQHSIAFLSEYTGTPYPWPHMTAVEGGGIIGGGMEFPQMTLMGDYNTRGDSALYYVTAHELAHMWVPMITSSNERRYAWFDEGTTTFNEAMARKDYYPGAPSWEQDQAQYLQVAGTDWEGEIMRRSDYHYPGPAYGIASYPKPGSVLVALRGLLGEETFLRAYREYFDRWAFKHPYPYDLWNTFEDVSGQDLDWFWHSWYYTTWTLDHALETVEVSGDGSARIVVEDEGAAPMPARLLITRRDGTSVTLEVPVDHWLRGGTRAVVEVPAGSPVTRVEIDPSGAFPDADRSDNVWSGS